MYHTQPTVTAPALPRSPAMASYLTSLRAEAVKIRQSEFEFCVLSVPVTISESGESVESVESVEMSRNQSMS